MTVRRTPPLRFSTFTRRGLKAMIHLLASGYLGLLFYAGIKGQLGPDPVETLLNETGIWAIHILIITLFLSPLAKWLASPEPIRFRRMLGIYVFVYALAHFSTYILFELQLDMALVVGELTKRPYIMVGMVALLLLLALTLTSLQAIRRKMGKNWQRLHNLIYLILPLAVLHFTWSQKTFWQEPVFYWVVTAIILSMRLKEKRIFQRVRVPPPHGGE